MRHDAFRSKHLTTCVLTGSGLTLVVSVTFLAVLNPSAGLAQTFQWPVDSPPSGPTGNDYSQYQRVATAQVLCRGLFLGHDNTAHGIKNTPWLPAPSKRPEMKDSPGCRRRSV
jgi:hypothetical protein